MNIFFVTKNYFFGLGLSIIAANVGQLITIKSDVSLTDYHDDDIVLYHLTHPCSKSLSELHIICSTTRTKLVIINDSYLHEDFLHNNFHSLVLTAKIPLWNIEKRINNNFKYNRNEFISLDSSRKKLTYSEASIITGLLGGTSLNDIAKLLNVSDKTIYNYKYSALKKLGAKKISHVIYEDFLIEKI